MVHKRSALRGTPPDATLRIKMTELELVERFLRSESTLALATTAADGSPRAAALFYLLQEDLRLCWFSSASSEHSRNLERDRRGGGFGLPADGRMAQDPRRPDAGNRGDRKRARRAPRGRRTLFEALPSG